MAPITEQSLSMRVVEAVADVRGVSVEDLPPLYHEIDLDALDRLFSSRPDDAPSDVEVRFQYEGSTVVVSGDGTVETVADESRRIDPISRE